MSSEKSTGTKKLFTVVVDSREQWPYEFTAPKRRELEDGGIIKYALDCGDYACEIEGELLPIRIERKTIGDYFGVVGHGRERFERELEKLARMSRAYLLIEATAEEIRRGYERSLVYGEAAFASALHWSILFGVQPIFAGHRRAAKEICQKLLEESAVHEL